MSDLLTAVRIAFEAHAGQTDKAGQPYILHPLRVMLAMPDDTSRIVAVLHDVAEDTDWQDISEAGFSEEILDAIDSVTRREGEDYYDYVRRAGNNRIGKLVKLADLDDNLSHRRIGVLSNTHVQRYVKARALLETLAA